MKKKYVLTEEQAILMFNVLDELYNVEDMSWCKLGNFDGMSTEEFKAILEPLMDAVYDEE